MPSGICFQKRYKSKCCRVEIMVFSNRTCKRGSAGQSEALGLSIPMSSFQFRLNLDNSNSHGFELHRPSGTKLLLKVSNHHHSCSFTRIFFCNFCCLSLKEFPSLILCCMSDQTLPPATICSYYSLYQVWQIWAYSLVFLQLACWNTDVSRWNGVKPWRLSPFCRRRHCWCAHTSRPTNFECSHRVVLTPFFFICNLHVTVIWFLQTTLPPEWPLQLPSFLVF